MNGCCQKTEYDFGVMRTRRYFQVRSLSRSSMRCNWIAVSSQTCGFERSFQLRCRISELVSGKPFRQTGTNKRLHTDLVRTAWTVANTDKLFSNERNPAVAGFSINTPSGYGSFYYPHNQFRTADPQAWSTVPCIVAQPVKNKVVATKIIIDLVIEELSNETELID